MNWLQKISANIDLTQVFQVGSDISYWLLQNGPIYTNPAKEVYSDYAAVDHADGNTVRSLRVWPQQITNLPAPANAAPSPGSQRRLKVPEGWGR
jgi:hypothetical protein